MKKVLVACEKSQHVTLALRAKGVNAFSCDTLEAEQDKRWHIQGDVMDIIGDDWHGLIAFPPCTFLSSVQTHLCRKNENRVLSRIDAARFFMQLVTAPIKFKAIENPTGVMTHIYREADQIVHPYYFGDDSMKRTGLWLFGLPKLVHAKEADLFTEKTHGVIVPPIKTYVQKKTGKVKNIRSVTQIKLSSEERSRLSPHLAQAMADQWHHLLK